MRHAARPCSECPWRRDQPAGRFRADRYEELAATSQLPGGDSPPLGAPLFACHKSAEGKDIACAGWLVVEGTGHITVRLAVVTGQLDPHALVPGEDWPELYADYTELAQANGADIG